MSSIACTLVRACVLASAVAARSDIASAQVAPRPQLYAVRNVRLAAAPDSPKSMLILRNGRIESILDAASEPPAEARVVDGQGMLVLPAFIDAFTQAGCATATPVAERDAPPKASAEALVDMREANRKGIQPSFRAADAFKLDAEASKRYRGSGFGTLLSAPAGQYLAGRSALATTRDVPARDALIVPNEFQHAGFEAPGAGYPGTLMGAIAQLRQFFLDAQRNRVIVARHAAGKPGVRPPYDADLEAILPALEGKTRVVCEADTAGDIERWIKLSDEFGFPIAISGGREAWKRAPLLKRRGIPVLLTLDWGEEVEDPHAKDKKKEPGRKPDGERKSESEKKPDAEKKPDVEEKVAPEQKPPAEKPEAEKPAADKPVAEKPAAEKPAAEKPAAEKPATDKPATDKPVAQATGEEKKPASDEVDWKYEEPMRVREERRRLWLENRDCALRLAEAGVTFAFGTGKAAPKDLLERVRTLVEKGLPADVALRALTSGAATLLGAEKDLGTIEPGRAATLALWTKDPIAAKDAKVAWLFVDGFPFEHEIKTEDLKGKPDDGVDATGTWTIEFENPQSRPATAELKMTKDGDVKGTIRYRSPNDETERSGDFEGHVAGKKIRLTGNVKMGNFEAAVEVDAEIEKNEMKGTQLWKFSSREDSRPFKATRKPQGEEESR